MASIIIAGKRRDILFSLTIPIAIGLSVFWINPFPKNLSILKAKGSGDIVSVKFVDPLYKVLHKQNVIGDNSALIDVALGETATFQLVLRSDVGSVDSLKVNITNAGNKSSELEDIKIGYVGYVQIVKELAEKSTLFNYSNDGFYPDPILKTVPQIPKGNNQPIWVSVKIPEDQKPGNYNGQINLTGILNNSLPFSKSMKFTIIVHGVNIVQNKLWISNWWSNGPNVAKYIKGDILDKIAKKMQENRINAFIINSLESVKYTETQGKFGFDFSNVDKQINSFLKAGLTERIEGIFLAQRASSDWNGPFYLRVPQQGSDGRWSFIVLPLSNERVKQFYSQYLPALANFLKKKNIFEIFYQHIADEPTDGNAKSYNELLSFVKSLVPNIKTIDAVQTDKVSSDLDVIVPLLSVLSQRFESFKHLQNKSEVGFYTCWLPQADYANRLIEMDLIKSRYLPWIAFRYNLSGYMHWGFDQWSSDNPLTKLDKVAGDSWIVYPENGDFISSIRLEALRDGIADFSLLNLLRQKNPDMADKISSLVIRSFDKYELNVNSFRKIRKDILIALEQ